MSNFIHPTAIVSDKAIIGKGNYIDAYTVIYDNVTIGDNNHIGAHCIIGDHGESIRFFDKKPYGIIIGNNNRFTKQATIDLGTIQDTIIGNNVLILKNGHVGHDAIIHDNSQVRSNVVIGGHCVINENCIVSLNSVIQPRITLPIGVTIGACSNVTKKSILTPNFVHYGNPCKPIRPRD